MANKHKVNPRRIPVSNYDRGFNEGIKQGTEQGMVLVFQAVLDTGLMTDEMIDALSGKITSISESLEQGRISVKDLKQAQEEEYGVSFGF